jgi:Tol biopolymer transport system component
MARFAVGDWLAYNTITDQEYTDPSWTSEGDLILWDLDGGAYRLATSQPSSDTGPRPEFLFDTYPGSYHSLSPDGSKLLFLAEGHVWTIGMDGTALTQITTPQSAGFESKPEWSPDGRYILLKSDERDNSGALWIVASDGRDARVGESLPGVMPLRDGNGKLIDEAYGPMVWLP